MGLANDSSYGAAKAAIWGLGNSLIPEARDVGVQVSTILPVAWTPMTDDAFTDPLIRKIMVEQFPSRAVSAFVAWLAHQDTTVYGESFEIGGASAARTVFAAMPRLNISEATPEMWAAHQADLMRGGDLTALYQASDSFRAQVVNLVPEMDAVLPTDAADVSSK